MANISVANTSSQLSGKTITTAEGDWTISGAWTFSGNQVFTGNVTLGNAVGDTLTVSSTIVSNLLFTDATYDIGASGATRPRDFFLSRNAVVGGTLGVTGVATFTAASVFSSGFATTAGNCYVGDTSNANSTLGLTINQGAADNEILCLKSSDVAHGVTDLTETDSYAFIGKGAAATGGMLLTSIMETGENYSLWLRGITTDTTATRSTSGLAPIIIEARLKSGTGTATMGADKNLLVVQDAGTSRFFLDSDGDSHQDVGVAWTNFDSFEDDSLALEALAVEVAQAGDPFKDAIRAHFGGSLEEMVPREKLSEMKLVTFNDDGHHFVNMSKLAMLHTGAIRQLARRNRDLELRLETAERKLLN